METENEKCSPQDFNIDTPTLKSNGFKTVYLFVKEPFPFPKPEFIPSSSPGAIVNSSLERSRRSTVMRPHARLVVHHRPGRPMCLRRAGGKRGGQLSWLVGGWYTP